MNRTLKIFSISVVVLLLAHGVSAKPVDATRARRVAENYMQAKGMKNPSALADVTAQTPFTEFYVFASPEGGFVLVSGDDCAVPVLGYSLASRFETKDMPENVKGWLEGYENDIRLCRANALSGEPTASGDEWTMLEAGVMPVEPLQTAVAPLLTTTWNQSPRYNDLCPYDSATDARSVTGCVATATAQVMKFWNHPATGYGSNTYTSERTKNGIHYLFPNLTADFGATTYQWSNMPNALTSVSSQTEIDAVATLMYHVGVAIEMSYSPAASGAHNYNFGGTIRPSSQTALMKNFKYRADMTPLMRDDYSNAEMGTLLRAELDQQRPILFDGSNTSGGHSFVFDGYDASGKFHVNWGWGGSNDGFFELGSLNPGVGGIGGNSSGTYNMGNVALIGIRPNTNWSTTGITTVTTTTTGHGSASGGGSYSFGDTVALSATANSGYRFAGWSDGCKFNPREIIANGGSYTFTATFAPISGDTLHYCPGNHKINNYRSTSGATVWGVHLPASVLNASNYLGAVQLYVAATGTYTMTVYTGSSHNTVAAADTVTYSDAALDSWKTIYLNNPVPATQDLWIVFSYNGSGYPASFTYGSGVASSFVWGSNFGEVGISWNVTAMIKGIFSDGSPIPDPCNLIAFPYTQDFDDGTAPCWEILDSNADGTTWGVYGSGGYNNSPCMRIKYADNSDDWLMMPQMTVAGDYAVAWKARIHSTTYPETYQVLWYDGTTATQLFQETLNSTTLVDRSANFTVPATGGGRIVFRYLSNDMYYLYLDNVVISQVAPTPQYTITTASNNNDWGTVTGGGTYAQGTPIQIEAIPATCYRFVRWQDNNTQNPRPFTVTANATYTATFEPIICTVSVSSNNTAWGTVSGGGTYQCGTTSVTLSAQPNTGYHFVRWSDNNTDNPRTMDATGDTNLIAIFYYNQYSVTLNVDTTIHGTCTGGGSYNYLSNRTIQANANHGYHFTQWNDSVTDNPRTIVLTQDTSFTAFYAPNQYSVTGQVNSTEMGLVSGSDTVYYLDTVVLTATANYGYHFLHWSDYNTDNPRTVVATDNIDLTAIFDYNPYTIILSVDTNIYGTVSGEGTYNYLSERTITATPNYGYHFTHWQDGDTNNPRTIILTQDTSFTAFFAPNRYSLTVLAGEHGTVSEGGVYDFGDTIVMEAFPEPHYHFLRWDDGNTDNPRQVLIMEDITITASFAIDTHTVVVESNEISRGMVEATGTEFVYGTPCTVTAIAYTGFTFAGWSNGVTANPYTFAVLSDVELTALFIAEGEEVYTVTVVSADPAMGSVSGGGQVLYGGNVTIRATPNDGYRFVRWNDNDTHAVRTVTVTADITYTATFEALSPVPQYTVTVNCVLHDGREVDPSYVTGAGVYDDGDNVTLEGFVQGCATSLDFWIIETGDTIRENPYTFVIHSNRTITAVFGDYGGIGDVNGTSLRLWPNPANRVVNLMVTEPGEIRVMDVTGRTVLKQQVSAGDNKIDVGSLIDGLYFVKMGGMHSSFIIQH